MLRETTADHAHAFQEDPLRFDVSSGLDKARQTAQALRDRLAIQFGEGDFEVARVCRVNEWEKVSVGDAVVFRDWGQDKSTTLYADSTAALAIAKRKGAGKLRRIDVGALWIQDVQDREGATYMKVLGTANPAD